MPFKLDLFGKGVLDIWTQIQELSDDLLTSPFGVVWAFH